MGSISAWSWIRSAVDRKCARIAVDLEAIRSKAALRGGPRPTILPHPDAGDAWADDRRAVLELDRARLWSWDCSDVVRAEEATLKPEKLARVIEMSSAALPHLRDGVRKAEAHPLIDWNQMPAGLHSSGERMSTLGLAALCQSRYLRESSSPGIALELLLDTAVFARGHQITCGSA